MLHFLNALHVSHLPHLKSNECKLKAQHSSKGVKDIAVELQEHEKLSKKQWNPVQ
jgi:hypothetical protein